MRRVTRAMVGAAAVATIAGCGGGGSSSPSSTSGASSTAASATTTTAAPTTTGAVTTSTSSTTSTTSTSTTTTTEAPTTTTEPPDTGTVDVTGAQAEIDSGFHVFYLVTNNTNHGVQNVKVSIDWVDKTGAVVVTTDGLVPAPLAPGETKGGLDVLFTQDHPEAAGKVVDAKVTVVSSEKVALPTLTAFEDVHAFAGFDDPGVFGPASSSVLGRLVNTSDKPVYVYEVRALSLNGFLIPDVHQPTYSSTFAHHIEPGESVPFKVTVSEPGLPLDRMHLSVWATEDTSIPYGFQAETSSPLSFYLTPTKGVAYAVAETLQVVGQLTNTGDDPYTVSFGAVECELRNAQGEIVDLSKAQGVTFRSRDIFQSGIDAPIEPGETVPFACQSFDPALALPDIRTALGTYTVEVVADTKSFTPPAKDAPTYSDVDPVAGTPTFAGQVLTIPVTITNPLAESASAQAYASVYDAASGRLLAYSADFFQKNIDKQHSLAALAPNETGTITLHVDLPPGVVEANVRLELSGDLLACGDRCPIGVAF